METFVKIAIIVVIIIVGIIIFSLYKIKKLKVNNSGKVADYNKKVNIWNNVSGNSSRNKLDDMNIDYTQENVLLSTINFFKSIVNKKYEDIEKNVDTFSYLYEIKSGYEKQTYEDEPYIIPYLVENSDSAVIIIPGGGFGYKSIDGTTVEGRDIAKTLNKNGINAFVLHYRTNPYEYPIPYLDLQRAIRYIRFHEKKYHIDKNKISLIGFSAGGNEIGTFINIIQGNDFFSNDYIKDEIDEVDDFVNSGAMIYPALSFRFNVPMLFCMFNGENVRNEEKRNELLEKTDLYKHITSKNVKQFIAYGTMDLTVGMNETKKYIKYAKEAGIDMKVIEAKNQEHGFKQKYYMDEYIKWVKGMFIL